MLPPLPKLWCWLSRRRWIERNNSKLREKPKKEEVKRLKAFVESAFQQDPRMNRRRAAEKAVKCVRNCACGAPNPLSLQVAFLHHLWLRMLAEVVTSAFQSCSWSGSTFYAILLYDRVEWKPVRSVCNHRDARKNAKDAAKKASAAAAQELAAAEAAAKAEADEAAAISAAAAKKTRQVERKAMQKERSKIRSVCGNAGTATIIECLYINAT